jgi:hypothetical protein
MIGDHGGFGYDDTNLILLVTNPSLMPKTVSVTQRTAPKARSYCPKWRCNSDSSGPSIAICGLMVHGPSLWSHILSRDQRKRCF